LGVKFVPAGTDGVLFSVWDVRVQDFQAYAQATGYQQTGGISVVKVKTAANGSMGLVGELDPNANWEHPGFEQGPTHPVEGVSWNDAKAFCQWLTKKEQSEGKLAANQQYRLPTDVEWRMAMGWKESSDDKPEMLIGHIIGIRSKNQPTRAVGWEIGTSPVGGSAANSNGLYDLGNVWEWCEDGFYENAYRVARRAWWSRHDPEFLLGSMSTGFNQSDHRNDVAFRVVVVVSP
jgi:formylglycine-generating enzyme required for sulfatase activity